MCDPHCRFGRTWSMDRSAGIYIEAVLFNVLAGRELLISAQSQRIPPTIVIRTFGSSSSSWSTGSAIWSPIEVSFDIFVCAVRCDDVK